jgi:hypothetical protein
MTTQTTRRTLVAVTTKPDIADLETEILDLVRNADLALHVCIDEKERPISEDGDTLQLVLEDLVIRAKALKKTFYEAAKFQNV